MSDERSDVELIVRSWTDPEAFGAVYERHAEEFLGYWLGYVLPLLLIGGVVWLVVVLVRRRRSA